MEADSFSQCSKTHLKHFDLTGSSMEAFARGVSMEEGLNLDAEWDSFFTSMFLWGELSADAIHLDRNRDFIK